MFRGKDAILSGPAGGVVAAIETAKRAGFARVIGFDMGGTSTDVSHYDGEYERAFETEIAGIRMRAPMMRIHTVAAGGGSVLKYEQGRYQVGPQSAGANPGPACLSAAAVRSPSPTPMSWSASFCPIISRAIFGPERDQPLDGEAVRAAFIDLAAILATAAGQRRSPTVSCKSPSPIWPTPSRKFPSSAVTTSPSTRSMLLRRRRGPACLPGRRRAGP